MEKVVVGMSGGVDSAVCAYLLKQSGYDVIGLTLKSWVAADGSESRCCEIDDARAVCDVLDIPYYVRECTAQFKEKVTDPFMRDYINGITPNPCIVCNRYLKWEKMLEAADDLGAAYIATGHYAFAEKLDNGRYSVRRADCRAKDQTYMLYMLTQEQLSRTLMPLGKLSKDEVRKIAAAAKLPVADKGDSQEICFVPDDDHARFIEENYEGEIPPEGNFVNEDGVVLGHHKGIFRYTIGQRKGLGLSLGVPMYVKYIDTDKNEVVLCEDEELFGTTVICSCVNMMSIDGIKENEQIRCTARIRYHHKNEDATASMTKDGMLRLDFDRPVRAAAPGQSAVMYDSNGYVIGGGVITEAF